MTGVFRATAVALLAVACSAAVAAAPRTDCHAQAVRDLERLSPRGHAVYRAVSDKRHFFRFLTCDDVVLGLATAVHESVHMMTADTDAYPLIEGGAIQRPREGLRFFAPREIAKRFDQRDIYVQTYLRHGGASSADDVRFLLDELNAYSHDLHSAVKLVPLRTRDREVSHRDGLAALMTFVMAYVDSARQSVPGTWEGLQRPEMKKLVGTLWTQAEGALASSCGIPMFGSEDRKYIGHICDRRNADALAQLLGRAPLCPTACLPGGTASSGGVAR